MIVKIVFLYVFLLFFLRIINDKYYYGNLITAVIVINVTLLYILNLINIFFLVWCFFIIIPINYFINRYFVNSKVILIKDGKFNFNNSSKYSFLKVLDYLKERGFEDISKVDLLYVKNNKLFLENNKDFVILINNGKIIYKGLKKLNKSMWWLRNNLKNNNVRLENILLAFYKNNKTYFIKKN